MKTIKQLKTKISWIKKHYRPILASVKVTPDSLICTNLETSLKIKDTYGMGVGLQPFETLGLIDSLMDDSDYPDIDFELDAVIRVVTNSDTLQDLVRYSSKDETRVFLNSIAIDKRHMVATNGYIMKSLLLAIENDETYIMPRESIEILVRTLKAYKIKECVLKFNEEYCVVDNSKFTLSMRLIQRDYPKWQTIAPAKFAGEFIVEEWIDYKEVKALFDKRHGTCTIKGDGCTVVLIPKNYPDKQFHIGDSDLEFEIGVNVEFLNIAANGQKSFVIKFNNALTPTLVNGAIVMPVKL